MPDISEGQTREQLIDSALGRAGWDVSNPQQVGIEVPVDGSDGERARWLRERRVASEAVESPDTCPNAGGLNQNIYG